MHQSENAAVSHCAHLPGTAPGWVLGAGCWYLVGLVGVGHDLGGVADEEHEHDGAQQRRHGGVPPVPRGDRVVELAVSGVGEKRCVRLGIGSHVIIPLDARVDDVVEEGE